MATAARRRGIPKCSQDLNLSSFYVKRPSEAALVNLLRLLLSVYITHWVKNSNLSAKFGAAKISYLVGTILKLIRDCTDRLLFDPLCIDYYICMVLFWAYIYIQYTYNFVMSDFNFCPNFLCGIEEVGK